MIARLALMITGASNGIGEAFARISLRALERNKLHCIPGILNHWIALAGKSGLAAQGAAL